MPEQQINIKPASPQAKQPKAKSTWPLLGALLILLLLGVFFYLKQKHASQAPAVTSQNSQATSTPPVAVKSNSTVATPTLFPLSVPLDPGGVVLFNRDQSDVAQRSFSSKGDVQTNYNLYYQYFQKNGWTISVPKNPPTGVQVFNAAKDNLRATVSIKAGPGGTTLI